MAELAQDRVARVARSVVVAPPEPQTQSSPVKPLDLALTGAWFGLATGALELGWFLTTRWITGEVNLESLHMNRHFAWMMPLCDALLFSALGLLFAAIALVRRKPRLKYLAIHLFTFLSVLSLVLSIPKIYISALVLLSLGLSWRIASGLLRHADGFRRVVNLSLPVMAAGLIALVAIDSHVVANTERNALAALPPAPKNAPDVLLIVLDTVRADALSPYGSARNATPNLAKLASKGVRFDQAISTAPWTLTSHCALFTGRWPLELSAAVGHPLDDSYPTLAEFFSSKGYATGGFVANMNNCNAWYGLARGFTHYEDYYENSTITGIEILRSSCLGRAVLKSKPCQKTIKALFTPPKYVYRKHASMVNRDALAWLGQHRDRPTFTFLNYFDVHDPYVPAPGAARPFKQAMAGTPRDALEAARDDYDDCLVDLDEKLGRLFDSLKKTGRLDNTLIIITADHGEGFGEHNLQGHGISLYQPELRVPLLVVHPKLAPAAKVISTPVSTRNIAATITDLTGYGDTSPFPGSSLARLWESKEKSPGFPDPIVSEVNRAHKLMEELAHVPAARGVMRSLREGRLMYIRNGDGIEELYDLAADPDELHDLSRKPTYARDLTRLRESLGRLASRAVTPIE
jgi:arylsulfatase A-like enzyme